MTNTGERDGSDVVQVYVGAVEPLVLRPVRELAGFAKVHLAPGETGVARVQLVHRSFARWDVLAPGWVVDPGEYDLIVAASAADERVRVRHRVL